MFTLHNGDCLQVMPSIPSGSVNLAILDLPYNISKAHWDKWKKEEDYIAWVSNILLEVQRTLADNGSLYFFHNDMEQVAVIMEWIRNNTKFIFKQFIVWNKRYEGAKNKGFLDGFVEVGGLRNYQQMAEYVLFYTFQDETGLNQIQPACFTPYTNYMTEQKKLLGWSVNQFNEFLGYKSIASHWFWQNNIQGQQPQPRFIAEKDYTKLQSTGYFQKEYEALRLEYEALRYTFNNQKSHHSVWNYEIAKANGHATPKPIYLITNIIMHSSKEGDLILDPTIGSGTTIEASERTGRNSIGIEKDEGIFQSAVLRLKSFTPSNTACSGRVESSGSPELFPAEVKASAKVTRQSTRR